MDLCLAPLAGKHAAGVVGNTNYQEIHEDYDGCGVCLFMLPGPPPRSRVCLRENTCLTCPAPVSPLPLLLPHACTYPCLTFAHTSASPLPTLPFQLCPHLCLYLYLAFAFSALLSAQQEWDEGERNFLIWASSVLFSFSFPQVPSLSHPSCLPHPPSLHVSTMTPFFLASLPSPHLSSSIFRILSDFYFFFPTGLRRFLHLTRAQSATCSFLLYLASLFHFTRLSSSRFLSSSLIAYPLPVPFSLALLL